ncbi:MAG: polymer-forming cytoskeletal protein [Spirochaetales bacterium]
MSEIHHRGIDERELDTTLGDDFDFEGEMEFSKPLKLNGSVRGSINATSDFLIGVGARVEASVKARYVDARGTVVGNIIATHKIELSSTARVKGDITAPEVVMEAGARLNGLCTMLQEGNS